MFCSTNTPIFVQDDSAKKPTISGFHDVTGWQELKGFSPRSAIVRTVGGSFDLTHTHLCTIFVGTLVDMEHPPAPEA